MSDSNSSTNEAETAGEAAPSGPSMAGMAASFAASMTQWAAGNFSTVEQARHDARLATCHSCKYFAAPRCTVCGCFADKKAWLPHEDCPIGKWPG